MKHVDVVRKTLLGSAVALACLGSQSRALAQEGEIEEPVSQDQAVPEKPADILRIEEIVSTGRMVSAAQQLMNERMEDVSVTDILGADSISRMGDSTVSDALRRVPGLSLVADKFVYIRGLGERYSASFLNGAVIPSPDLSRNVIPLDVFPTSVVQSLRVQKSWSPDMPANFGGGSVDIRTLGIPSGFASTVELGTGYNSLSTGSGLTYAGGGDDNLGTDDGTRALSPAITDALDQLQGNVSVQNILAQLQRQNPSATLEDAQLINRQLGLELNRDIGVESKSLPKDLKLRAGLGNSYDVSDDLVMGYSMGASYQTDWRKTTRLATNFVFPETRTDISQETTFSVNAAGTLNLGATYLDEHTIATTTLWLRNTDDETEVRDFFNENREIPDGLGFRNYRLQFEERDMLVNQVRGTHLLGSATREKLPLIDSLGSLVPVDTSISWFYSDAGAGTSIPNQVEISSQTVTDTMTTEVLAEQVLLSNTAGDFRFTELSDEVENYGWEFELPYTLAGNPVKVGGGYNHARKTRSYEQTQFSLGATSVSDNDILQGSLDSVFSDTNILDTSNNFVFDRQGTNNESYIAATMTDAFFGQVEWTYADTWRLAAGARWEDYRQASVQWNPYGYSLDDPQVTQDADELASGAYSSSDLFPSVSVTYMSDWMAEIFQLRFGWSQTAVRPDLREITAASYIDPITGDLTRGNTGVKPAAVDNLDIRAEWFFDSGDTLTATLFRKNIEDPIEYFESAASDTTVAREIVNASTAQVQGIELEAMKQLGFLGSAFETLFVQGNVTLQSSELVCDLDPTNYCAADAPTNRVRNLSGASDYVANLMLGFDSPEGRHSASLIYNVFGERLYVAGRNGSPDGFEQPFNSVDFTYAWYPTDSLTLKFKAQNLLDETITIKRNDIVTYQEDPGQSYALLLNFAF